MWTEFLKIKPVLDSTALKGMTKTLNTRFTKVAKGFGRGLKNVLKGAGVIGAVTAIADKLLNPLKETQTVFDRILQNSDNLATNAKLFETSAGRLFKLQAIAHSVGVKPELLFQMLSKFQLMLARTREEQASGGPITTPLAGFTGEKDVAEAFFKYIQSVKKATSHVRTLANARIFGDELPLRAAELFQLDVEKKLEELRALPAEAYEPGIQKAGGLSDLNDTLEARRMLEDSLKKFDIINEDMVYANHRTQQELLQRENIRLKSYESLKAAEESVGNITNAVESGFTFLYTKIPMLIEYIEMGMRKLDDIGVNMKNIKEIAMKIADSKIVRGIGGWFK